MPPSANEEPAQLVETVDTVLDRHGQDVVQVFSISAEEPPLVPHSRAREIQVPLFDVDDVAERCIPLRVEMPDDEVPVHDVDDQDASRADEFRILLEDLDVRVFVVIPEGRPEVERGVEGRGGRRHALRETPQISDLKGRSTGQALTSGEFSRAGDEHRGKVYAHGLVADLRETGRMPSDAAGGVDDSAIGGHAEPFQDRVKVARLLLARGPGVLVDREEHLRMTEEQLFGPVGGGHRLAMWLALFGGVAVPHAGSLRVLVRLHDSLRVPFAASRRQSAHVRRPLDFVLRLGTDLFERVIGGHEDQHDLRRMLFEEPDEATDPRDPARRDRLHEEQDRTATCDDGGLVFRRAARGVVHPEPKGAMLVRQPLAVHLRADGRLEFRPARMAGAPGHRPAPSIASTIARANAEVRTSLAPGMRRAKTYVTDFAPSTG